MRKLCIAAAVFSLLLISVASAQERLGVSPGEPRIDGIVSPGEYSLSVEIPGAVLHLNRTQEVLSIAVQSELEGWVAVGLGSTRMDQASIYIGYVDSGKEVFATERGRGHKHDDASVPEPIAVRLKEDQSGTVLELGFPVSAFVPEGADSLGLIVANGLRDNLSGYHSTRRGLEIDL
ncbi:MAG: hypothetical protein JXB06_14330 [Spirochaetales bacterium]|nr:hypothetical protein [Spirochaetales bacterium]